MRILFSLGVVSLAGYAVAQDAMFTSVPLSPEATSNSVRSVSNDGRFVTGTMRFGGSGMGYRWDRTDDLIELGGLLNGALSSAWGISGDGTTFVGRTVVGSTSDAFYWKEGIGTRPLGRVGDFDWTTAFDASFDGSVIVGASGPRFGFPVTEGFRWTEAGGMEVLGHLGIQDDYEVIARGVSDDGNIIVGDSEWRGNDRAFRWTRESGMVDLGSLPGGNSESDAQDLSPDGQFIVGWSSSTLGDEAFRWSDGEMIGLGILDSRTSSVASAVSADGTIVVGTSERNLDDTAFIWFEGQGMFPLKNVLELTFDLDLTGWSLEFATGISADGSVISGTGVDPDGVRRGWVAVIPAPSGVTTLLMAGGLFVRRRRR